MSFTSLVSGEMFTDDLQNGEILNSSFASQVSLHNFKRKQSLSIKKDNNREIRFRYTRTQIFI